MSTELPRVRFFAEFADYVETIQLSKEELLILDDFNVHIDVVGDNDAYKLPAISLNQSVFNSMLNNILTSKVIL